MTIDDVFSLPSASRLTPFASLDTEEMAASPSRFKVPEVM